MNFSNTDEAFVLATLKEFVKKWNFESRALLNLVCQEGTAWVKLALQLGHPAALHDVPRPPPGQDGPPRRRNKKGPARREKDRVRAAAHRARQNQLTDSLNTPPLASHPLPPPAVPVCGSLPPPGAPAGHPLQPPAALAGRPIPPPAVPAGGALPPPAAPTGQPLQLPAAPAGRPLPPPAIPAVGSLPPPAVPVGGSLSPPTVPAGHSLPLLQPPAPTKAGLHLQVADSDSVDDEFCPDREFLRYLEEQKRIREIELEKMSHKISFGFNPKNIKRPF